MPIQLVQLVYYGQYAFKLFSNEDKKKRELENPPAWMLSRQMGTVVKSKLLTAVLGGLPGMVKS